MAASGSGSSLPTNGSAVKFSGDPCVSTTQGYDVAKPVVEQQPESDHESITDVYLDQIKIECALLKERKQKFDVNGANVSSSNILKVAVNRVDHLYYTMFCMHTIKPEKLKKYMEFRKDYEQFLNKSDDLLDKLIFKKHKNPIVYITAANYQYHNRCNIEKAREYLKFGIDNRKNNKSLHAESFLIEIQNLLEKKEDCFISGLNIFQDYVRIFDGNLKFHFQLLDKILTLKQTSILVKQLQYCVMRDMMEKHKHKVLMWQKLAKVCFDGFIYDKSSMVVVYDLHYQRRLMNSFKSFEDGINELKNYAKECKLWNLYAQHVIDIWINLGFTNNTILSFLNKTMSKVFQSAHQIGALSNEHYVYWAEYTSNSCDESIRMIAIEKNKDNIDVWANILQHYADLKKLEVLQRVFKDGLEALKEKSMRLWEIMHSYLKNNNYPTELGKFYRQAVYSEYEDISSSFRLNYMKWFHKNNSLSLTRKLFKEMIEKEPNCKEFYTLMITYEQSSTTVNEIFIRKLYDEQCIHFGHNDVDVWNRLIKHDYIRGNRLEAKQVYQRAITFLSPQLINILDKAFENIKAEIKAQERIDPSVICISDDEE